MSSKMAQNREREYVESACFSALDFSIFIVMKKFKVTFQSGSTTFRRVVTATTPAAAMVVVRDEFRKAHPTIVEVRVSVKLTNR